MLQPKLSPEQIQTIKSMSSYWDEVSRRENKNQILFSELQSAVDVLGVENILAILKDHINGDN